MGIRVAGLEGKTMCGPLIKSYLQAVVAGRVEIRDLVNISEIRKACIEWSRGLFRTRIDVARIAQGDGCRRIAGTHGRLVDVSDTDELRTLCADIGNLQRHFVGERMLKAERPGCDEWIAKIAIYRRDITRSRVSALAISALNGSRGKQRHTRAVVCPVLSQY